MAAANQCWICGGRFPQLLEGSGDGYAVDCTTCGKYTTTSSLHASAFPLPDSERYRFSHWNQRRQLEGRERARLTTQQVAAIVADLPNPPTHSKADILLVSLTRLHPEPGKVFSIDPGTEYSLSCARNEQEGSFFLRGLVARGDLQVHGSRGNEFSIMHQGWERAAQLAAQPNISKTAFVALHFSEEMLVIYHSAFEPAIKRAGFEPRLANVPAHNDQIDARIVAEIRQSRFVVADVTGARTGVYFEAGCALGQGRPVIWTCRKSAAANDMHFDTRQYNHILWDSAVDLTDQLYFRIAATI
jgi:nucleoside 2-deoxyribosyltransferase